VLRGHDGPRGPAGSPGATGAQGPPGISADQLLNTTNDVTFDSITAGAGGFIGDGASLTNINGAQIVNPPNPFDQSLNTTDPAVFTQIYTATFFCNELQIRFFANAPVGQQEGGDATASGTYGGTEQEMLNAAYSALRAYGLLT
jgi:hypothetical protein